MGQHLGMHSQQMFDVILGGKRPRKPGLAWTELLRAMSVGESCRDLWVFPVC